MSQAADTARRRTLAAVATALIVMGTAACGGTSSGAGSNPGSTDTGDNAATSASDSATDTSSLGFSPSPSASTSIDPTLAVTLHPQTSGFSVTQDNGVKYSLVLRTGDLQDPSPGISVALLGPGETNTPLGLATYTPSLYLPLGSQCHDITAGKDKVLPFAVTVVGQGSENIPQVGVDINPGQDTGLRTAVHIEAEAGYRGDSASPLSYCSPWGAGDDVANFQPTGATAPYQDSTMAGFLVLKDYQAHQADFAKLQLEIVPGTVVNAKQPNTVSQFTGAMKADTFQNVLNETVTRGGTVPLVP